MKEVTSLLTSPVRIEIESLQVLRRRREFLYNLFQKKALTCFQKKVFMKLPNGVDGRISQNNLVYGTRFLVDFTKTILE